MGKHKTNPTAIAAKAGLLPPKKRKPSKREGEMILQMGIYGALNAATGGLIAKIINENERGRQRQ